MIDVNTGLRKRMAAKRLKACGFNTNPYLLHQDPSHSAWPILSLTAHTLASGLISMGIYVTLSIIGGQWWQVGAMAALLSFFLFLAWFHTLRWRSVTRHMKKMLQVRSRVLRDGIWSDIPSRELVPGDIICLWPGKIVPARCVVRLCSEELIVDCRSVLTDKSILTDISESLDQGVLQIGPEEELPAGAMVKSGEAYRVQVLNTGPNAFLHHRYYDGLVSRLRRDRRKDLVYTATRFLIILVAIIFVIAVGATLLTAILSDRKLTDVLATATFLIVFTAVHNPVGLVLRYARTEGARRVALRKGKRVGAALHTLTTIELLASIDTLAIDTRKYFGSATVDVTNVYPMKNCTASGLLLTAALATTPEAQAAASPLSPSHITPVGDMEHINMAILEELDEHQQLRREQAAKIDDQLAQARLHGLLPNKSASSILSRLVSNTSNENDEDGGSGDEDDENKKSAKKKKKNKAKKASNKKEKRKYADYEDNDTEVEMRDMAKDTDTQDRKVRKRKAKKDETDSPSEPSSPEIPPRKSKKSKTGGNNDLADPKKASSSRKSEYSPESAASPSKRDKTQEKDAKKDSKEPLKASKDSMKDSKDSSSIQYSKDSSSGTKDGSPEFGELKGSKEPKPPKNAELLTTEIRHHQTRTGSALRSPEAISSPSSRAKRTEEDSKKNKKHIGPERDTIEKLGSDSKLKKEKTKKTTNADDVEVDLSAVMSVDTPIKSRKSAKSRIEQEGEHTGKQKSSAPKIEPLLHSSSAKHIDKSPYSHKHCMKLSGKDPCLELASGEASAMEISNYIRLGALFPPGCTVVHMKAMTAKAIEFARESNPVPAPAPSPDAGKSSSHLRISSGSRHASLTASRKSKLSLSSKNFPAGANGSTTSVPSSDTSKKTSSGANPAPAVVSNLKMAGSIPRDVPRGEDDEDDHSSIDGDAKSVERDCAEGDPAFSTFLVAKGDPRSVIRLCVEREDKELVERIDALVEKHCKKGRSVVAVAKGVATSMHMLEHGTPNNMNLVGLLFFDGETRADTMDCLMDAYNMNMTVKLITNDSVTTGTALAERLGIGSNVITIEDYLANDPRSGGKGVDLTKADGFAEVTPENRIHLSLAAAGVSENAFVDASKGGVKKSKSKKPPRPLWGISSTDPSVLYEADVGITHRDEPDVAIQSADIVLMTQGLFSLIRAIKQARRTISVLEGLAVACAVQSLRNIVVLVAAWVTYGFQPIPTTSLTILVALNLPMLLFAAHFENGRVTRRNPTPFLLRRVAFTSFVVALFEVVAALLLGVVIYDVRVRRLTTDQADTVAFLWFGIANGFIILLCRSPCGIIFKRPWPHPAVVIVVFLMQVITSCLAFWGVGMKAIGITNGLAVWAYTIFFFLIQNLVFYASRLIWTRHLEPRLHSESWFMLWHKRLSSKRWYRGLLTG